MSLHVSKPAPSGLSVYAVLRRGGDDYRWIVGNGFEAFNAANLSSYAIALTDDGGDVYSSDVAFTAAAGRYIGAFYVRAGATPANDDFKLPGEAVYDWTGTGLEADEHYATRADIEGKIGVDNVAKLADLNGNESADEIAARVEDALTEADSEINAELALNNYAIPLTAISGQSLPSWLDRYLRDIAADFAAQFLMSARDATQPVAQAERADMANRYDAAKARLARLIELGIPGAVIAEDETADPGTFQFVPINRDVCSTTGDENARPLLWY